jgi:hypothetical protein
VAVYGKSGSNLSSQVSRELRVGIVGKALKAVDYKTGKVKWSRPFAMGPAGTLNLLHERSEVVRFIGTLPEQASPMSLASCSPAREI